MTVARIMIYLRFSPGSVEASGEDFPSMPLFGDYLRRHFIEATQRIQRPGVSHPWQQLRDDIKQHVSAMANIQIASHVPLDLRFHATQGNQNGECNELPNFNVEPGPGVVSPKQLADRNR